MQSCVRVKYLPRILDFIYYDLHILVYITEFHIIQRVLIVVAQSRVSLLTALATDIFAGMLNLLCTSHIIYLLGFLFIRLVQK